MYWSHASQQVQIYAPWKFAGFGVNPLWPLKQILIPSKIRFFLVPCEMLPSRHAATHAEPILAQKMNCPSCQHVLAYPSSSKGAMSPPCGALPMKFTAVPTVWGSQETVFPKFQSSVRVFALLCQITVVENSGLSYQLTLLQILMGAVQRAHRHIDLVYCHSCFWQLETICLAGWIRQWVNHKNFLSYLV